MGLGAARRAGPIRSAGCYPRLVVRVLRRAFDELTRRELHDLLALRARVFVVEQACVYLDIDGEDLGAHHVLAVEGSVLVACARILPPGARFDEPAIGRVVVAPEARGRGLGRALMREAMDAAYALHGPVPLVLSAQAHLEAFYASLGFLACGPPYEEDGIPHVEMRRAPG